MTNKRPPLDQLTAYELIDWLDQQYPHKCIAPNESSNSAHRRAGARDLVDALIHIRRREEKE